MLSKLLLIIWRFVTSLKIPALDMSPTLQFSSFKKSAESFIPRLGISWSKFSIVYCQVIAKGSSKRFITFWNLILLLICTLYLHSIYNLLTSMLTFFRLIFFTCGQCSKQFSDAKVNCATFSILKLIRLPDVEVSE